MFGIRSDGVWASALLLNLLMIFGLRSAVGVDHSESKTLKARSASLRKMLNEAELKQTLLQAQLEDDRDYVLGLIPETQKKFKKGDVEDHQLRSLASVISPPTQDIQVERASSLMKKAKVHFQNKDYSNSNQLLEQLLSQFPTSVHILEAHYLLAEGCFEVGETDRALALAESMLKNFPTHELTGFTLLRVAQVLELRERPEDANEFYRSIQNHFSDPSLRSIASEKARGYQ